jgi:hypothetical protein
LMEYCWIFSWQLRYGLYFFPTFGWGVGCKEKKFVVIIPPLRRAQCHSFQERNKRFFSCETFYFAGQQKWLECVFFDGYWYFEKILHRLSLLFVRMFRCMHGLPCMYVCEHLNWM